MTKTVGKRLALAAGPCLALLAFFLRPEPDFGSFGPEPFRVRAFNGTAVFTSKPLNVIFEGVSTSEEIRGTFLIPKQVKFRTACEGKGCPRPDQIREPYWPRTIGFTSTPGYVQVRVADRVMEVRETELFFDGKPFPARIVESKTLTLLWKEGSEPVEIPSFEEHFGDRLKESGERFRSVHECLTRLGGARWWLPNEKVPTAEEAEEALRHVGRRLAEMKGASGAFTDFDVTAVKQSCTPVVSGRPEYGSDLAVLLRRQTLIRIASRLEAGKDLSHLRDCLARLPGVAWGRPGAESAPRNQAAAAREYVREKLLALDGHRLDPVGSGFPRLMKNLQSCAKSLSPARKELRRYFEEKVATLERKAERRLAAAGKISLTLEGPATVRNDPSQRFKVRVLFRNEGPEPYPVAAECPYVAGVIAESPAFSDEMYFCSGPTGLGSFAVAERLEKTISLRIRPGTKPGKHPLKMRTAGYPRLESNTIHIQVTR